MAKRPPPALTIEEKPAGPVTAYTTVATASSISSPTSSTTGTPAPRRGGATGRGERGERGERGRDGVTRVVSLMLITPIRHLGGARSEILRARELCREWQQSAQDLFPARVNKAPAVVGVQREGFCPRTSKADGSVAVAAAPRARCRRT
ncbi:hypothetical protein GCM10009731_00340 [Streptomyces globosus]